MARDRSTYRSSRRNYCIRELKTVWGPNWYYKDHRNAPEWWVDGNPYHSSANQNPIHIPAKKVERKQALGKGDIHAMLKRGDYAAAVRKMYDR
jgi:hypothetical protein